MSRFAVALWSRYRVGGACLQDIRHDTRVLPSADCVTNFAQLLTNRKSFLHDT